MLNPFWIGCLCAYFVQFSQHLRYNGSNKNPPASFPIICRQYENNIETNDSPRSGWTFENKEKRTQLCHELKKWWCAWQEDGELCYGGPFFLLFWKSLPCSPMSFQPYIWSETKTGTNPQMKVMRGISMINKHTQYDVNWLIRESVRPSRITRIELCPQRYVGQCDERPRPRLHV